MFFSSVAQFSAFWADSVSGGCSGLKKYISALPSNFTISSRTPDKVNPFLRKNLAASLVPASQPFHNFSIKYEYLGPDSSKTFL